MCGLLINIRNARAKEEAVKGMIETLRSMDGVGSEFDEALWCGMAESMTVYADGKVTVRFKGGAEVSVA